MTFRKWRTTRGAIALLGFGLALGACGQGATKNAAVEAKPAAAKAGVKATSAAQKKKGGKRHRQQQKLKQNQQQAEPQQAPSTGTAKP